MPTFGPTKNDVIHNLAELVVATGRAEAAGLEADALACEEKAATGRVAASLFRTAGGREHQPLAFARLKPSVDFRRLRRPGRHRSFDRRLRRLRTTRTGRCWSSWPAT